MAWIIRHLGPVSRPDLKLMHYLSFGPCVPEGSGKSVHQPPRRPDPQPDHAVEGFVGLRGRAVLQAAPDNATGHPVNLDPHADGVGHAGADRRNGPAGDSIATVAGRLVGSSLA